RGRVLAQALRVRVDMAATRRRLRATFAELGEEAYGRLLSGRLGEDAELAGFRLRIQGLMAEIRQREAELREIMQCGCGPAAPGPARSGGDGGGDGETTPAG
ncbi:MAG: hypothetical protein ABIL09_06345, partial [Gemmatimonadota bacterium]